ncbi:MAG: bifunctional phosphopantothenoylcysteine decarboxylase/phosphopantothenate--cysteine ligase CoaBC [Clostridia bacterium]|nr:bifunctional phosphopantothenoylcysteine decarboxylase/phosphopantothenate--cysteine ligase CoaBC [Clostridia bacterium]MBQ9343019.1 bifunctional phosphopantothenoylcysteine decarboxylase/phosphopantothenate--cysteine ligase CoaBC [Clostridia bacterium]
MGALEGKTVVLGVTGGIAAYKSCEVVSRLRKQGAQVFVIMTKNACQFVAPMTFETLSNNPCVNDTFERPERWEVEHVALAKKADLFLIAPATANIMAKMAHGIADDMLSTTVLATKAPVLLAPAMNTGMWTNEATQENLRILKARGVMTIGPEGGLLACGDVGAGRMSEPVDIVSRCVELLSVQHDLEGLRVLVTAGPTREPLDPVRFITNRSSGKMGYAIAEAAQKRGAHVTLVSGPVSIAAPGGVAMVSVQSTEDLLQQMTELAPQQDIIIQAAAPADYRAETVAPQKMKKNGNKGLTLKLVPTPDVARAVGELKQKDQTLVGFAAETENLADNAQKKLDSKNLDMIVANDVTKPGAGFDVDTNIAMLITRGKQTELPLMSKRALADAILDRVLELRRA